MKRILLSLGAFASALIFWSALSNAAHSPGGQTGSPGDGSNCTFCHTGTAQTAPANWITTNIPASGYVPGKTYTITLTGTYSGVALFGFELTAEDTQNNKTGTWAITNSSETQLTNMNHAVTHTANGLTPVNNAKSWSFNWTAPAAATGDITFYAALNAANGDGGTAGDVVFLTQKLISENTAIGIDEESIKNQIAVYPNPVQNYLVIEAEILTYFQIIIKDMNGKNQLKTFVENNRGPYKLDVSNLASGMYFIQIQHDNYRIIKRFVKQ